MARSCLETPKIASHHVYFLSLNFFSQVDAETKGDMSSRSLLSEFKSGHDLEWCWLGQTRLAKEVEVMFKAPWVTFGLVIPAITDDTLIPQEPPIVVEAMARTRESRAKNPRQTRQATPPHKQPQYQHQQEFPSGFYTHFDTSMSQVYRRLDQQQEENRRSFEAINTRMDRMDDQLSFLCYSNQMTNEQMLSPYQNTARQFKEMEMQGIPVTMANLAIYRQREEEVNQERMRYNQILQEVAAQ
ncbi:hypothetical protein PIB30_081095 [Stylosanthes scabra]|uniref:Uncharacterized protein n=1 Tax=Stylosanthes scabra TaxID=79078 RepID=A0ABU6UU86_9FABA|nr:hypothetical protein [Stylosanthes scabra]